MNFNSFYLIVASFKIYALILSIFQYFFTFLKIPFKKNVPEVLNVHINEINKKSTFFKRIFFQAAKN